MFLRLYGNNGTSTWVNTSKISAIVEGENPEVHLDGGWNFGIRKDELATLISAVCTDVEESPKKLKDDGVLSELNVLLGGNREVKETDDRKRRLKARLKDFTIEELKLAAKNLGNDEYMQGDNDSGKRWGTLDYLIRTSENVNKWLENEAPKKKKSMF